MRCTFLLSCISVVFLASCSGTHSTIDEGYAYRMNEDQAGSLVDSVIRANVATDRLLPASKLVASGYDRSLGDTQTYTASAIPVPRQKAFGFEVKHHGTMFNGPSKASSIYETINQRAALIGPKVMIDP